MIRLGRRVRAAVAVGSLVSAVALVQTAPAATSAAVGGAPAVSKVSESVAAVSALVGSPRLSGWSYQQDAIVTYNGWQYAAYYTLVGSVRRVSLTRRQLPAGVWQTMTFNDYDQTLDDEHCTISVGVSPGDGTLHLSFDEHGGTTSGRLNYRRSVRGLLTHPTAYAWTSDSFEPLRHDLRGTTLTDVTYPRFVTTPAGGVLFSMRLGVAGNGAETLYSYDPKKRSWTGLGRYLDGEGQESEYLNGLTYGPGGRLHVSWVWRAGIGTGPEADHDPAYAYSDDGGHQWRRADGRVVGVSGKTPITPTTTGVLIWPVPQNSGLLNQEGQAVDSSGRVHVLLRDHLDDPTGSEQFIDYVRSTSGVWARHNTGISAANQRRVKVVTDNVGNVYMIAGQLRIFAASPGANYADWHLLDSTDNNRFAGEPLYDAYRLAYDGVLSIFYQDATDSSIRVLDYRLG